VRKKHEEEEGMSEPGFERVSGEVEVTLSDDEMATVDDIVGSGDQLRRGGRAMCDECGHLMVFHEGGPVEMRTPLSGRGCIEFDVEPVYGGTSRCRCAATRA
jgi:hypothetical protein